jgi:hypothetical protein
VDRRQTRIMFTPALAVIPGVRAFTSFVRARIGPVATSGVPMPPMRRTFATLIAAAIPYPTVGAETAPPPALDDSGLSNLDQLFLSPQSSAARTAR